jgi:hypothetical protein
MLVITRDVRWESLNRGEFGFQWLAFGYDLEPMMLKLRYNHQPLKRHISGADSKKKRNMGNLHSLHDKHPAKGPKRGLLKHLGVIRFAGELLWRKVVVAAQIRHVILITLIYRPPLSQIKLGERGGNASLPPSTLWFCDERGVLRAKQSKESRGTRREVSYEYGFRTVFQERYAYSVQNEANGVVHRLGWEEGSMSGIVPETEYASPNKTLEPPIGQP